MIIEKYTEVYSRIGENLRKRRRELGLTQKDVADKIPKMDRSKISDMENGKEDFVFSKLLDICNALDIKVKCILEKTE